MYPSNTMDSVTVYADAAPAVYKQMPTPEQQRMGVVPLDSLPAQWWNSMWNKSTSQNLKISQMLTSILGELNNVLQAASIPADSTKFNQLVEAITKLRQAVATSTTPGAVKSGGDISVAEDGTVTVNSSAKIGDLNDLITTAKNTVVAALNEIATQVNTNTRDIASMIATLGTRVILTEITGDTTFHDWAELDIVYDPSKTYVGIAHVQGNYPSYLPVGVVVSETGVTLYARHLGDNGQIIEGTPHKKWGVDKWGQGKWDGWSTLPIILQISRL